MRKNSIDFVSILHDAALGGVWELSHNFGWSKQMFLSILLMILPKRVSPRMGRIQL